MKTSIVLFALTLCSLLFACSDGKTSRKAAPTPVPERDTPTPPHGLAPSDDTPRRTAIRLKSSFTGKRVIFQTDRVRIEIPYDGAMAYIKELSAQPNAAGWTQIGALFEEQFRVQDTASAEGHEDLLRYLVAATLEQGACAVYDKERGVIVDVIEMGGFGGINEDGTGWGGRDFYLPDGIQFLAVVDWET